MLLEDLPLMTKRSSFFSTAVQLFKTNRNGMVRRRGCLRQQARFAGE
jgi:hypothetical protein